MRAISIFVGRSLFDFFFYFWMRIECFPLDFAASTVYEGVCERVLQALKFNNMVCASEQDMVKIEKLRLEHGL